MLEIAVVSWNNDLTDKVQSVKCLSQKNIQKTFDNTGF